MHRHFFSLLSDCDLVSVHSSSLCLQSGSPGTPQFHSQNLLQPQCTLFVCVLQNYCVLSLWMLRFWLCVVEPLFCPKCFCSVCVGMSICVCFVNLFYKNVFRAFLLVLHVPAGFSSLSLFFFFFFCFCSITPSFSFFFPLSLPLCLPFI